jgi:hypothetical protein
LKILKIPYKYIILTPKNFKINSPKKVFLYFCTPHHNFWIRPWFLYGFGLGAVNINKKFFVVFNGSDLIFHSHKKLEIKFEPIIYFTAPKKVW